MCPCINPTTTAQAMVTSTADSKTIDSTRTFARLRYSRITASTTAAIATKVVGPTLNTALYPANRNVWITGDTASRGTRYVAYWLNPMQPLATESGAEKQSWKRNRKLNRRPSRPRNISPR